MKDFTEASVDELRIARKILDLRIKLFDVEFAIKTYSFNVNEANKLDLIKQCDELLRRACELAPPA